MRLPSPTSPVKGDSAGEWTFLGACAVPYSSVLFVGPAVACAYSRQALFTYMVSDMQEQSLPTGTMMLFK